MPYAREGSHNPICGNMYSRNMANTWMPFVGWAEAYYSAKFGPKWEKQKKVLQEKVK